MGEQPGIGTDRQKEVAHEVGQKITRLNELFAEAAALGLEVDLETRELEVIGSMPSLHLRVRLMGQVKA